MTKHIHAELMMEYAKDAMETDKPWERWEFCIGGNNEWIPCDGNPFWDKDTVYRRKQKTIDINGIEVPEPYRGEMRDGDTYYSPFLPDSSLCYTWESDEFHKKMQELGMVHLSKEAAIIHAEALASLTKMDSK